MNRPAVGTAGAVAMDERELIDAALRRPGYADGLTPSLESDFAAETGAARRTSFSVLLVMVLCLSLVSLPLDVGFGVLRAALVLKLGVEAPFTLVSLWLLRREGPPWLAGLALGLSVVTTTGVLVVLGVLCPPTSSEIFVTAAGLLGSVANLAIPIRLRHAKATCLLNVTVYCGLPASGLLGSLSAEGNSCVMLFSMIMVLTLRATARRERHEQDGYLLRRRDALQNAELERLVAELKRVADRDALTDIGNRRCFDRTFDLLWGDARVEGSRLALAMIDIDHFKRFNDAVGHAEGDRCLRAVARAIAGQVRPVLDVPTRYGGEEFAVLMPLPGGSDGRDPEPGALAEGIRTAVAALALAHPGLGPDGRVTVSIGLAVAMPGRDGRTPDGLMEAADRALYDAKRSGRDRVVEAGGDTRAAVA